MSNLQANRTLSGSFAEVWVDGARIAELSQLTLTIKVQREKVQFGMDVDSKITGYAGEGTMTLKQVYTRFYEVLEQAKRGLDKRCTINRPERPGRRRRRRGAVQHRQRGVYRAALHELQDGRSEPAEAALYLPALRSGVPGQHPGR